MLEGGEALQTDGAGEFAPDRLAAANIHPTSRLATDYLNHFNNIVMLLDLVSAMPECIEEVLEWRPIDYCSYFAASRFRERDLAIRAFAAADAPVREAFEAVVAELDSAVLIAQDLLRSPETISTDRLDSLRALVRGHLQPLISEAGGIINGHLPDRLRDAEPNASAQESIDELFG
jgi:hypothetical protein